VAEKEAAALRATAEELEDSRVMAERQVAIEKQAVAAS